MSKSASSGLKREGNGDGEGYGRVGVVRGEGVEGMREERSLPTLRTHAHDRVKRAGFSSSDRGFGVEDRIWNRACRWPQTRERKDSLSSVAAALFSRLCYLGPD